MDSILGTGNQIWGYVLVLGVYLSLFVVIRQIQPTIEPTFRRTFWLLFLGWVPGIFIGNYLFYLIGIMSFLPWLDNLMHSSIWIGLGLGFLYAATYKRALWEQCVLGFILSFAVKLAENKIIGTWDLDHFFFIQGNLAYIIGWSVVDGLYPVISMIGLRLASRYIKGLAVTATA